MTAHQQPRPQAVPIVSTEDSEDRDDGPNPVGVVLLLCLPMLVFWAGVALGVIHAMQVRLP